jgi:hypothetical protein
MRLYEFVDETFNNPQELNWVKQTPEWWKAEFQSHEITYWVNIYAQKWREQPCWVVDFGVGHKDAETHGLKTTAPTGLRKPHSVISSVKAAFDEFMHKHRPQPQIINFYDSDSVESRSNMYERFAKYVCSAYGYTADSEEMDAAHRKYGKRVWLLRKV